VTIGMSAGTAEPARCTRDGPGAHSGQRIPTDVAVMQSGQIGRPQLEHDTPVSRPLWR
jgi:hypothetical protein